jgi:hypothetical protein
MTAEPTISIVGGDALARATARELGLSPGRRVVVLWPGDGECAVAAGSRRQRQCRGGRGADRRRPSVRAGSRR